MLRLNKSIEIDAPVEQVFVYVVDPTHHPEWDPGISKVKDIQRLSDGRSTYTSVSKVLGLPLDLKEEQVELIPNERIVFTTQGTGIAATTTFRFERMEAGMTRVGFVSEITLHGPGPLATFGESALGKYMHHGIEMGLETLKAHIETAFRLARSADAIDADGRP